ncbi:hypothetical protein [Bordetella genomosp. 11]|uniref:SnoaL-like domain-containing protein n=1 Tax=Bordetella genomosp. 11 TaxID=1416808 RepID=A0A261UNB9_9BORD|nr:hypothetical protein [Bordetella genomosp. 11]OZI62882.1 hypothetical protein CAL28_27550 [Bordetella genomosp. 11]
MKKTTEQLLRDYFHAKDENRPWYMADTFAPDARLEMVLKTAAIAFPSEVTGEPAIADTLVRAFGQTYDNVYTFYFDRPAQGAVLAEFSCDWMVAMTEKATGKVRVGHGRYDWRFQAEPHRVRHLTITIESMETLAADTMPAVFAWITSLPYPWLDRASLRGMPALPGLESLRTLAR